MKLTEELIITGTQEIISISAGSQSPGLYQSMENVTTQLIMLQIMKIVEIHSRICVMDVNS